MNKDNPEAFETFEFDLPPIRGFPELRWAGKRPFKSTQYFPAQKKEAYGDPTDGWWNRIYWGDNLQVMSHLLREFRGKVDLVYLDPPFSSNADYKKKIKLLSKNIESDSQAFEEKQYKDIWSNDEYNQFIFERLAVCRELLSENGLFYVHCDFHKSHHVRCIMDEIFGPERFVNEIVWKRTSARSDSSTFNHIHDVIFIYSKSDNYYFNQIYIPHEQSYIDKYYSYRETDGRRFATINATQAGLRNGSSGNDWRGFSPSAKGNHWKFATEELDRLDAEGRIYWPQKEDGWPRLKSYLDELKGAAIQSIWTDIKAVNSQAAERVDYPTQKPAALLQRIIESSCPPGGIVFDCFMGSGTTQAVAMKSGRKFLGADINLGAIETTVGRLNAIRTAQSERQSNLFAADNPQNPTTLYTGFEVYNVNNYDLFRNPVEAKELIREAMEMQPLPPSSAFDGQRDGYLVKIMPVNRIATRQDLNEVINGLDFKAFERRKVEAPNKPVERIHLVCMGHEPDLGSHLTLEAKKSGFDIEVMVTDLIRDKAHLHFKKSSDARLAIENGELVIKGFYPMNLLQKLSLESDAVEDWRQLVESVKVDFHYDGAVLTPAIVDAPGNDDLVAGRYAIPADAATIRVKITDLLSESWEGVIENG
ncbi:site-specific DNA-methyltransferase [Porphyrobacter sp. AAP82]|uniref:site-specific DNA-methyltransferase n=1 Tax=Porphyrobacter sp. AAP82 TaxID=1248917 RepID=UPI0002D310C0|nr:site-specific DNA-methyltransferase [Porphyrobacter sp. AAP82]